MEVCGLGGLEGQLASAHLWWQQWSGRELPGTQDPCPAARGLSPGHTGQLGGAGIYLRGQLSSRERPRLRPPPPPRWLGFGAGATCLLRGPPGPLSSSRQEPTLDTDIAVFLTFWPVPPISSYFRINHLPPSLGLWSALRETPH